MRPFAPFVVALALVNLSFQDPPKKAEKTPAERQEAFFAGVKAGETERAFKELMRGAPMEGRIGQVANLTEQLGNGVKALGGVAGWENHGLVRQGKHSALGLGVLCFEQGLAYFYFGWFRKDESAPWTLFHVAFDDKVGNYWLLLR